MDEVTTVEIKRLHDEEVRQNNRIELLEKSVDVQNKLAISVERLALSMEQMLKEQEKQGKRLDSLEKEPIRELATTVDQLKANHEEHEERIIKLEKEPAERWNNMTRTAFTSVISTLSGGLAVGIIMLVAQYIK